ncbi:MAG TPA: serine/threonine-protein kinase [Nocardia sp.]|uniref:serine/threonine-protein kinase n=1 Tax=Nocardia TaxID=1817 RepID=UPI0024572DEF|nr:MULTISPECIES: serine/threonine-protein kinase [Nocardia]HLS78347.1 serine/threonine-protein kinase [Nocardia sp.]
MIDRARPIVGPDYLVAGRYRLRSKLGGGGMGAVWLAHDRLLDREVAIKQVLTTAGLPEAEAARIREQIVHEGRVAAKLSHEHAIAVYDVVLEAGEPWLVMEHLPSRSVARALGLVDTLPVLEVAQIGAQVADALAAAHAVGIVHRDIKPGNILVADRGPKVGFAKLSDFGISRGAGDAADEPDGVITGTPAYLPPEVARGAQPTTASDVFSLGATLYTAIEGQPPFGMDEDSEALVHRAAMAQIIPPQRTGELTEALLHMMEPAPQRRPTMAEARDEILAAAFGPGTASYILGTPVRTEDGTIPSWATRNGSIGVRSPHSAPLPRPHRPGQVPRPQRAKVPAPKQANAALAVTIGLLIGLIIIIGVLVIAM